MSRWLQAARTGRYAPDKTDETDETPTPEVLSVKSVMSEGGKPPSEAISARVSDLPPDVLKLLDPSESDELWMRFEERAAILEFDGGHTREQAELIARAEIYGEQK